MPYEETPHSELLSNAWESQYQYSFGDFLGKSASHSFERDTTIGSFLEDRDIRKKEEAAGQIDKDWELQRADSEAYSYLSTTGQLKSHKFAMAKDEYEKSEFYREGIEWREDMTPVRAQIYAEIYDRRRYEEQLLSQSSTGIIRPIAGFGASMMAQLPDPINLIPVGGQATKGVGLGRRILRGVVEGGVSTAVADAVILPEAARRGEDISWHDLSLIHI